MVGNDTIHTVTRKEHDCIGYMDVPKDAVSYTHLTLPTIYSV